MIGSINMQNLLLKITQSTIDVLLTSAVLGILTVSILTTLMFNTKQKKANGLVYFRKGIK